MCPTPFVLSVSKHERGFHTVWRVEARVNGEFFSSRLERLRLSARPMIQGEETVSWRPEVIEIAPASVSKELKKRWSYFIRKVYETDPLTCPKCQGEIRIISFIDQPEVIKKILQHLGLWEESHAPPENDPPVKEITFDPSCGSINSPS